MDRQLIRRGARCACIGLLAALAGACHYLRPAELPLGGEYFHYRESNTRLVVLLHGLGGSAHNFVRYGTVEQLRTCRPDANIYGANSHFGYYRERIIGERLRSDIIEPARRAGVDEVWLMGVSLGAFGGIVYNLQHPRQVEGFVLMAPFLGEWSELEAYIDDPQTYRQNGDAEFAAIWQELESMAQQHRRLVLAYGEEDGFRRQHRWLAGQLEPHQVVSMPGGHHWSVWRELWPEALRRSGLCTG